MCSRTNSRRSGGFTLIEAMIVLALGSILIGVAVPAWSGAVQSAHATSAKADLLGTLTRSISHAASAGTDVVLCPGNRNGCRSITGAWRPRKSRYSAFSRRGVSGTVGKPLGLS